MPQKSWSKKDERQYEHVKESERDRGRSEERAEEIRSTRDPSLARIEDLDAPAALHP